jgi:hypothetical protein
MMTKTIPRWKEYPHPLRDEELVRNVMSDRDCNPLERHLAQRIDRLLYRVDDLETEPAPPRQMSLF